MSATGTAASGEGAAANVKEAETLFQTLRAAKDCHSLLHKHLTQAVFDKIKDRKTALGGTLVNCMRSGVENIKSHIGVYASDPEAYKTFQELFDAVIKDYHKLPEKKPVTHPASEFGDLDKIKLDNPDPEGKFVLSTRIRVGRSQENYEFCPIVSKEKRLELENNAKAAFEGFGGELKGTYHPLTGMTDETKKQLTEDHFLFNDTDNYLLVAGGYNDWPSGRGIFFNHDKTFLVWVNEEDHLRIISMQPGADIGAVYKRLINGINAMGEKLKFVRDDRLGFVTFCPTNLGTSLRASVHIKIPRLAASDKFKATCDKLNLQARGIHGENSESEGGVYDISNKRRLGLTEIQAVQEMYNGVKEIIRLEKELAWRPENMDEMFDHLTKAKTAKSLLKKHLTKDTFDKLKEKKTSHDATLGDCILSGVLHLDSGVGIYAADPESYNEFALLFDPIIKDYHKVKASDAISHPAADFGDLENLGFENLDPEGEMVISTRIRVGRSHKEFAFPPVLTKDQRLEMEKKSVETLNGLDGDLKGTYHALEGMSKEKQEELTTNHFLFNDSDRFLKAAGGYNDWPSGRGIFYNEEQTFLVWVNEEDHLRIISMQKGGDIAAVYKRLVTAIKAMEEKLPFARDDRLGYLTFCPTNLGTTLRASVHIKIPHLSARKDFKAVCEKLKLQARGIHGEHTDSEGGVYDISNKRRLGLSEIEAVKEMVTGVHEIIRLEKEAATGKTKSCQIL